MHEYGITDSLLSVVLEQAKKAQAKRVSKIDVVLGELAGVSEESVQFYFDLLSKDSIAAGACLSFRHVPGRECCVESIEVD